MLGKLHCSGIEIRYSEIGMLHCSGIGTIGKFCYSGTIEKFHCSGMLGKLGSYYLA
jgi:hypothetical protein